jgi:hypothetical protein
MIDTHIYTVKEIALIGECPRKHWAKYGHRLPDPKHPAAEAGIQLHNILERMLREGPQANTNPESEVGGWARSLYPLAPVAPDGRRCHAEVSQEFEVAFERTLPSPALPNGVVQLVHRSERENFRSSFRIDFVFPDFSGFGDWKSCAGPRWALAGPDATPAQQQSALANDLQANLEAYGFMKVMSRPSVDLMWCYVNKRNPSQVWTVRGRTTFLQAEAWLRQHALPRMRLIRAMRALNPKPEVRAVPHEITGCDGSGRNCAFLGQCQMQPSSAGLTTEQLYQLVR